MFVELKNGQNGALTRYPGKGYGTTWLGADGATLTLEKGIIIASRGMGTDVMGGYTNIPVWNEILIEENYTKSISYLNQDNKLKIMNFDCIVKRDDQIQFIEILDTKYTTNLFVETCTALNLKTKNMFYVDKKNVVRRSVQHHSKKIGYVLTERLD